MNKILGIDLGSSSIGWAIRDPNMGENQLEKAGVITFNKGVGSGKTGEFSFAAERTKKRSGRRLYQARKYRLWATLQHLIEEGYCPLNVENLNRWRYYSKEEAQRNRNGGRVYPVGDVLFDAWIKLDFNGDGKPDYTSPYQLRRELAEQKLDLALVANRYKLGRALYHIAQRRGFKSSRKVAEEGNEKEVDEEVMDLQVSEKKKNKHITELFEKYPDAATIGALYARLEDNNIRIRSDYAQYAIRENYKDEIKHIFQFQGLTSESTLYAKLVETAKNRNDGSIFYKRPLRSQKGTIGKCTLEPSKYRVPVSHPSYEYFRAWSFLNNIKYKPSIGNLSYKDNPNEGKQIDMEMLREVYQKLFFRKKAYFPFSDIEEYLIKKGKKWTLNYKPKATVMGCPISARLKHIFGPELSNIKISKPAAIKSKKNFYDLEDVWHVLFSFDDQEHVTDFAIEKLGLDADQTKQFVTAWNTLPVGYAMLSLNAINKINRFLSKGLMYAEAVLLANMPSVMGSEKWESNETYLIAAIGKLIEDNRKQKTILNIVNSLVAKHKNLSPAVAFGIKDSSYKLDRSDFDDVEQAAKAHFGTMSWNEKTGNERDEIIAAVQDCYQAYFMTTGLKRKDINHERHFIVMSGETNYYKSDSGFYRIPKLRDTLAEFIQSQFQIDEKSAAGIYHPSDISIYQPARIDEKDGLLKLGSPKTGSFKNPMAMRALHELRKLVNYLIETQQIDEDTRVVVEIARELNDANKRWAIEVWQKQREAENMEYANAIRQLAVEPSSDNIDKMRLWYEQNNEEAIPPVTAQKREIKGIKWTENKKDSYKKIATEKSLINKYRLWKEQDCQCIYTGQVISLSDLFNDNVVDFEHTIPRSISFDNSLANMTVCFADFNRNTKKNQLPYQLNNYEDILGRIEKWQDKIERIKQQIDYWQTKSKRAADKPRKDDAIRQRHLWKMELDYWQNKVNRFTTREVTSGFKNSQLIDTQLISKYALHYLKTYFNRVDVQKGAITAIFRKIFGLQVPDEQKDRNKHSHHAKDAAVLTFIPVATKREEILKTYYEYRESRRSFTIDPYAGFRREYVWGIDDTVIINNISKSQALTPAKRIVKKRGKVQFIGDTDKRKVATGDCIRGQLHQETFYGAIKPAKRGEYGNIERDADGKIIQEEQVRYVIRLPFLYKSKADAPGFKTMEEIEKKVVDEGLKKQIKIQVEEAGGLKEAFEAGIYMLNKRGERVNEIRHIRCWASVSEPLSIKKQTYRSASDYKNVYYAANATNSYFAIYENGGKKHFEYRNLLDVASYISVGGVSSETDLFEPSIPILKGKTTAFFSLKYVLKSGLKIIFMKDEEDVLELSKKEVSDRLYVFTNFEKDGRLNLRHHLEARNKIDETYNEAVVDFENPKPTLRFGYAKYSYLVEGYDFSVAPDGALVFAEIGKK